MTADDLNRLLTDVVPELPELPDRPERADEVRRRVRRRRTGQAVAAVSVAVAAIAVGAVTLARPSGPAPVAGPGPTTTQSPTTTERPVAADPIDAANRLVAFARNPTPENFAEMPFAAPNANVRLALGAEVIKQMPSEMLADPVNWRMDVDEFAGFSGPFSVLKSLQWRTLDVKRGEHKRCANPPTPPPVDFAGVTQVAIQPDGIDSCIDWFAVDLYLGEDNSIIAVRLDLFGP